MRISYLSHEAFPSPSGDFRVVTLSFFVGKGIGPRITTPVLSAISLIELHTSLTLWMSMLANFILAFCIRLVPHDNARVYRAKGWVMTVKRLIPSSQDQCTCLQRLWIRNRVSRIWQAAG